MLFEDDLQNETKIQGWVLVFFFFFWMINRGVIITNQDITSKLKNV